MRHALLTVCLAAGMLAAATHVAAAQDDDEPERPELAATLDTNDAAAYYNFGLNNITRDPEKAADAFYWATRLNPSLAKGYYARRVALLLRNPRRLLRYWQGNKSALRSKEIKHIDSLYLHALMLDPFVHQGLEQTLLRTVVHQLAENLAGSPTSAGSSEIEYEINRLIMTGPASLRAQIAYGEGQYAHALSLYATAIDQEKKKKDRAPLRVERARLFYEMNQPDSALAELLPAIEEMRTLDKKDLVYVYQSKALTEYSIALAQLRLGDRAAARESLGRALEEDLSYYPAHLQLGFMALEDKDTTTALGEMSLAVQIKGDDPWLRYTYGYTLAQTGKPAEAETQLRKAIELDPVFAPPHFILAQTLDAQSRSDEAVEEYRRFLALASRGDLRRPDAEKHVAMTAATQ